MRPFTPAPVITAPSPPVRTLRHRNLLWAYRARVFAVHIGDPSSNQATTLESQMIHMIQELFGQTLSRARVFASLRSGMHFQAGQSVGQRFWPADFNEKSHLAQSEDEIAKICYLCSDSH